MSDNQQPWWLVVNKPKGLVTTVWEQPASTPGKRTFVVRGEPVIQGLMWLTCGPVGALVVIAVLAGLAVALDVRAQGVMARVLFIAAFLGLPALVWGLTVIIANRASASHVQALRQAETQECRITLDQQQGRLTYRTAANETERHLDYNQIKRVRVTPAIGTRGGRSMNLVLETDQGPLVLLNDKLGSQPQKTDLVREIERSMQQHKKNPPRRSAGGE